MFDPRTLSFPGLVRQRLGGAAFGERGAGGRPVRTILAACLVGLSLTGLVGAAAAHAAGAAGTPVIPAIIVPRNITYWQMFANATAIVKIVMLLLLGASIATWSVWLAKVVELRKARVNLATDIAKLDSISSLSEVAIGEHASVSAMLKACRKELGAVPIKSALAAEGVKERLVARLGAIEAEAAERMVRGTAILATIGSIAPFVGLFGTVWGIMNSFIGISESNTTNLAVVAPGIAEALLATAMGLVAAIPAVIMFNQVARAIATIRRSIAAASTQVACLLSHELDVQLGAIGPGGTVRAA